MTFNVTLPSNGCAVVPSNATYGGAAYGSNCQAVIASFNHFTPFYQQTYFFFFAIGMAVLFIGVYAVRVYYERWARKLWKYNGVIGIGKLRAKAHGVIGKLKETYSEKMWLFEGVHSGGLFGRGKFTLPVIAVPGSIVQMPPEDGGVSFALVDLDRGATVNPTVEAWAAKMLSELAESHDFQTFAFKWKLKDIEEGQLSRLPELAELLPSQTIIVPMAGGGVMEVSAAELDEGKVIANETEQQRAQRLARIRGIKVWYEKEVKDEQNRQREGRQLKAEIEAIMAKSETYTFDKKDYDISLQRPTDLEKAFTHEMANSKGDYARALIRGEAVDARYVARVMEGTIWPADVIALEAKIRQQILDSMGTLQKYGPIIAVLGTIGMATLFGSIGIAVLLGIIR